jgi:hypothetical protein
LCDPILYVGQELILHASVADSHQQEICASPGGDRAKTFLKRATEGNKDRSRSDPIAESLRCLCFLQF